MWTPKKNNHFFWRCVFSRLIFSRRLLCLILWLVKRMSRPFAVERSRPREKSTGAKKIDGQREIFYAWRWEAFRRHYESLKWFKKCKKKSYKRPIDTCLPCPCSGWLLLWSAPCGSDWARKISSSFSSPPALDFSSPDPALVFSSLFFNSVPPFCALRATWYSNWGKNVCCSFAGWTIESEERKYGVSRARTDRGL